MGSFTRFKSAFTINRWRLGSASSSASLVVSSIFAVTISVSTEFSIKLVSVLFYRAPLGCFLICALLFKPFFTSFRMAPVVLSCASCHIVSVVLIRGLLSA